MRELLEWIRQNLGAPGEGARRFSPKYMSYNRITPPSWVFEVDEEGEYYQRFYQERHLLMAYAQVYWGHIIQANSALWEEGDSDHPCSVVYSTNPELENDVSRLGTIAHRLFELKKDKHAYPDGVEIHDILESEVMDSEHLAVPLSITDGLTDVFMSSMMVARKHLPSGYLKSSWFPILADKQHLRTVMFLPAGYWPQQLVEFWD